MKAGKRVRKSWLGYHYFEKESDEHDEEEEAEVVVEVDEVRKNLSESCTSNETLIGAAY